MEKSKHGSPAKPGVVLGLTFLIIGLTFAFPYPLMSDEARALLSDKMSPAAANVYACTAWAGWAHFVYAFRGQGRALAHIADAARSGRLLVYVACLLLTVFALAGVRWQVGIGLFSAIVWIYFIDHFIKAEQMFEGSQRKSKSSIARFLESYQPLIAFSWLTLVLLDVEAIRTNPWVLWSVSLFLGAGVLVFGGWKRLAEGEFRNPILAIFFIAETLVWGTLRGEGIPSYLHGVYIFHIAAGSYFHYLGSYFVGNQRSQNRDWLLTAPGVVLVNVAIICLGYAVTHIPALSFLGVLLAPQWFTLWVAVHLVASDTFPAIKTWRLAKA